MEIYALLEVLRSPLAKADRQQLSMQLEEHIRYLMHHDMERLVQLLYSVDINEQNLQAILQQQPPPDAVSIISSLIIERQEQKEHARQQFRSEEMDDEERW